MSKRHTLFFLLLALLLPGGLSACTPAPGGDNQDNRPTAEPTSEATAEPTGEVTAEVTEAPTEQASEDSFPVTLTDALGNEVTLAEEPQRIVSLTLGADEILLELVGPERLIGVTYNASDASLSNIADHPALAEVENIVEANPEQLIALQPDLIVIGTFNDPAVIEQLANAGLTLFAINATNIEEVQASILTLGELIGETEQAQQMVEAMNDRLAAIDERLTQVEGEHPRVLYLSSGGWVAGSQTTVDAIIQRAGGVNIAAQEGLVSWNQVSEETIIELNPDLVILSTYVTDEEFRANPVFADLNAVQNERVYAPSDALLSTTSQYIVLGVEELAKLLYPELFPAD